MKIIERIHNVQTGEIQEIERDETAAETKERLDFMKSIEAEEAQIEAKNIARQEILDRLGISAEEAKLLVE